MSNKTTNLGLSLVDTSSESSMTFRQWRRGINAEGTEENKSDFQIIDEFAGHIYGVNGTVTLVAASWDVNNKSYTCLVDELGDMDAIFFKPSDLDDKAALDEANCFVTNNGQTVTFYATTIPTSDINLNYFISRGK